MKKLLPILIISILIISGIGISAAPVKKDLEIKPQNTEDWNLELTVKGGLFGYTATVTNTGTASISGNLTIQVHSEPKLVLLGKDLETINDVNLSPEDTLKYNLRTVFGIGSGFMNFDVVFITDTDTYIESERTDLFVLFIYCKCNTTTINLP